MAVVCAAQVYCDGVDRIWAGRKKYIYDYFVLFKLVLKHFCKRDRNMPALRSDPRVQGLFRIDACVHTVKMFILSSLSKATRSRRWCWTSRTGRSCFEDRNRHRFQSYFAARFLRNPSKIIMSLLTMRMSLPDPEIFGLAFRIALDQLEEKTSKIGDLRSHLMVIAGM